jgi:hypothetical protein
MHTPGVAPLPTLAAITARAELPSERVRRERMNVEGPIAQSAKPPRTWPKQINRSRAARCAGSRRTREGTASAPNGGSVCFAQVKKPITLRDQKNRSPSSLPITSGSVMDAVSDPERTDRSGMDGGPIAAKAACSPGGILVASPTVAGDIAGLGSPCAAGHRLEAAGDPQREVPGQARAAALRRDGTYAAAGIRAIATA